MNKKAVLNNEVHFTVQNGLLIYGLKCCEVYYSTALSLAFSVVIALPAAVRFTPSSLK